jgi:hypothetical protein
MGTVLTSRLFHAAPNSISAFRRFGYGIFRQIKVTRSRLQIRENSKNKICKKSALQTPKPGKFDYFATFNHLVCSMASRNFTSECSEMLLHYLSRVPK